MRLSLSSAATLAALLIAPAFAAAQSVAVPSHTPKDAIGVLSLTNPKGLWDGYAASPVAKPLGELITLAMAMPDADMAEMQSALAQMDAAMGFNLAPASFLNTISGMDVYATKPASEGATPGGVAVIKFNDAANAQKMLDFAKGMFEGSNPNASLMEMDVAGLKVFSPSAEGEMAMAVDGGVLLIGMGSSSIAAAKNSTGTSDLFSSAAFTETMTTLAKNPHQLWVFGNGEAIAEVVDSMGVVPAEAAAGIDQLRAQKAMAMALNMSANGLRISSYTPMSAVPANQMELVRYGIGKSLDVARALPAESLFSFASGNISLEKLMTNIAETQAQASGGMMTADDMMAEIGGSLEMMGLTLDEIFAAVGDNIGFSIERAGLNMANMSPDIDLTLLLQAKDVAKMEALNQKLAATMSQMLAMQVGGGPDFNAFDDGEYNGVKYLRLKPEMAQGMGGPVPAMGVTKDGYFVLALSDRSFQGAVDRLAGTGAGMDKSPLMTKLQSSVGYNPQQVMALNIPRVVDIVGNLAMMFMSGNMTPDQMQMMQKSFEVLKAAGPLTYTARTEENGAFMDFQFIMQ